jgi:2,3-diketo-5-methylthio-1-phosphopentane phosphatase
MVVFLDFDGTITVQDTSDALFHEFGNFRRLATQLMNGTLTVAEYYTAALASMEQRCPPDVLEAWSAQRQVDPGFHHLIQWLHANSIRTVVVSDGFDAYIRPILKVTQAQHLPLRCNTMQYNGERWQGAYPGASESCSCFCASCKRNAVLGESHEDDVIVYIGDGRSDTCAVQHADVVFAKDYLAAWCTEQRIPHHPYRTLSDVQRILASKLATGALRQRRQAVLARKAAYLEE